MPRGDKHDKTGGFMVMFEAHSMRSRLAIRELITPAPTHNTPRRMLCIPGTLDFCRTHEHPCQWRTSQGTSYVEGA
jgi:hypothetical protein